MRLFFLHGAPASGKFTIAKALGEKFGFGVFHNHLTIDIAKCFFEFGTDDFWEFVQKLRLNCFREAAKTHQIEQINFRRYFMAEINGKCDEKFARVSEMLNYSLDSGDDIGASVAVFIEGEPIVDIWGGYFDGTKMGTRHDYLQSFNDEKDAGNGGTRFG